jgi:hypothetical protein
VHPPWQKYSRRRRHDPDADIDYINERNMKFNQKLERFVVRLFFCRVVLPFVGKLKKCAVSKRKSSSVADSDPGSGAFLTPGSRMGKKLGSGSGMNNPDHIS